MPDYEYEKPDDPESNSLMLARVEATIQRVQRDLHPIWRARLAMIGGDHWGCYAGRKWIDDDISPNAAKPREFITVNEAGINFDRMMTFLIRQNPKIYCRPTKPEAVTSAIIKQAVINNEWRDKACQDQLDIATRYSVALGCGWVHVGMQRELNDELFDARDGNITYEDYIKEESTYIEAEDPFCMFFDLEGRQRNLETARWVAKVFFKAPNDVFNNKKYDKKIIRGIRSGDLHPQTVKGFLSDEVTRRFYEAFDDDRDRFVLIEIEDKKWRNRKTFVKGIDDPILVEDWFDHQETFSYIMIPYIEIPGRAYGPGLLDWIEDQQYELDRIRTHMFKHRRRFAGGRVMTSADVPEGAINALVDGKDLIPNVPFPPKDHIVAWEAPQFSQDEILFESYIKDDIRNGTGISEMLKGGNLPSRTSATEVNTRASLSGAILESRAATIDKAVIKIIRQMLGHIEAFYYKKRIVEIAGPVGDYWGKVINNDPAAPPQPGLYSNPTGEGFAQDPSAQTGGRYWVEWSKDDIMAETEIEIESTSAPRYDPVVAKQQKLQEIQLMETLNQQGILQQVGFNWAEYLRSYFEANDDKDSARYLPFMAKINPPLQTQTAFAAGAGTQPQPAPPQPALALPPGMSPQDQSIQAQAQPPTADILGAAMGGNANGGGA